MNFFKRWIKNFWDDFSQFPECPQMTVKFLSNVALTYADLSNFASALTSQIQQSQSDPFMGSKKEDISSFALPAPRSTLQTDLVSLFGKYKLHEIAQQITLVEWKFFRKARPEEFLDGAWLKSATKMRTSPNCTQAFCPPNPFLPLLLSLLCSCHVYALPRLCPSACLALCLPCSPALTYPPLVMALQTQFADLSNWVKTAILTTEKHKDRVLLIKRFIELATVLKEMRNYNGSMEILAGLDSAPVYRLRDTMDSIMSQKKYVNLLADLKAFFNAKKGYTPLREAVLKDLEIEPGEKPKLVLPYVNLVLQDLQSIEEKNPRMVGSTLPCPPAFRPLPGLTLMS